MSVDIYVMPLRDYKFGNFESPLQQVFGSDAVKRVTPHGIEEPARPDTIADALAACIVNDEITELANFLNRAGVGEVDSELELPWKDSGQVCFSEQARVLEAARTYALWLSHTDAIPVFESPTDKFYSHAAWDHYDDFESMEYPQIVLHDMFDGYFLPCDFPSLLKMELDDDERSLGSSFRLREELKAVGETVGPKWKSGVGLVGGEEGHGEALVCAADALMQLSLAAEASCKNGLPIIFDG